MTTLLAPPRPETSARDVVLCRCCRTRPRSPYSDWCANCRETNGVKIEAGWAKKREAAKTDLYLFGRVLDATDALLVATIERTLGRRLA
jgi:hypothetical protein